MTVGLSRVYAGEHYWVSDVLGGWLSGGALLGVAIVALDRLLPGGTSLRRVVPSAEDRGVR